MFESSLEKSFQHWIFNLSQLCEATKKLVCQVAKNEIISCVIKLLSQIAEQTEIAEKKEAFLLIDLN